MTNFTFKMTDEQVVAGIKNISNRSKSIRVDIHKLLCSITRNWAEDGAVNVCSTRMSAMLEAIDPSHQQKLVNWANNFCGFTLEEDDDGKQFFAYDSKKTKLSVEEWGLLKATNMFDFTPDTKPKAFNFQQKLAALIEQAEKRRVSKKKLDEDEIDVEQLAAAKALLKAEPEVEPDF